MSRPYVCWNIVVKRSLVPAVEALVGTTLGEDWMGRGFQWGPRTAPDGAVLSPDPDPDAAWCQWQGPTAKWSLIVAAVKQIDATAVVGQGVVRGTEDMGPTPLVELEPGEAVPPGTAAEDVRESMARTVDRRRTGLLAALTGGSGGGGLGGLGGPGLPARITEVSSGERPPQRQSTAATRRPGSTPSPPPHATAWPCEQGVAAR